MTGDRDHRVGSTVRVGSAGFTLLELLAAITVLALLTGLLFGGLQFGTRVWRTADAELSRFEQLDAAHSLLRRSLTVASPQLTTGENAAAAGAPVVAFDGRPDGVAFVAPPPAAVFGGASYRMTFAVVDEAGRKRLMFLFQSLDEGPLRREPEVRGTLLDGISRARFSYFGHADNAEEPAWHSEWREQERLPLLVSVSIEFPPGDRRLWPQLLVAPMLSPPLQ